MYCGSIIPLYNTVLESNEIAEPVVLPKTPQNAVNFPKPLNGTEVVKRTMSQTYTEPPEKDNAKEQTAT